MEEKQIKTDIISVIYENDTIDNAYGGKAYYYYANIELKVGDIVYAPTKYGDKKAMVAEINIPEEKVNTTLKTIVEKIDKFGYSQGVA